LVSKDTPLNAYHDPDCHQNVTDSDKCVGISGIFCVARATAPKSYISSLAKTQRKLTIAGAHFLLLNINITRTNSKNHIYTTQCSPQIEINHRSGYKDFQAFPTCQTPFLLHNQ